MTSPWQQGPQAPNPAMLARPADDGQPAIDAIAAAVAELDEVRELPVAEHVGRFEAVHAALTDALSKADNLLSATSAHRS
ncbi:hypothetical protein [Saccharopolyspora sp. ASAGF58]|uniref:hypothetical protein n=1 Tax=Saccharopolyspora sp. ASAGF58 TaxID=2719023 RepID=UPI001FF0D655|nr:hypothetical protein [Saccharopolyspora sp. ASAGF58]